MPRSHNHHHISRVCELLHGNRVPGANDLPTAARQIYGAILHRLDHENGAVPEYQLP